MKTIKCNFPTNFPLTESIEELASLAEGIVSVCVIEATDYNTLILNVDEEILVCEDHDTIEASMLVLGTLLGGIGTRNILKK